MPRVEVKAEMHWLVWPLKPGKFCSGGKNKLGESAVMVTVLFPGFDPMPAKKYCQACFDSMYRFWERNQLIQPVEVASTGEKEGEQ